MPSAELGVRRVALEEIFRRADVVSLHLPATGETTGLVGPPQLSAMKPEAILVNTSRGPLVDSRALARALREGEIGAAGLDVYEHEPDVPTELREAPRCVLLPHIGSATTRSRDGMARLVAENVLAVLGGERAPEPGGLTNPATLGRCRSLLARTAWRGGRGPRG